MIIENQGVLRGALAALLSLETDLVVTADAVTGQDVYSAVELRKPDVLVIDTDVHDTPDLSAIRRLTEALPDCKILILAARVTPAIVRRALDLRVHGVIGKDSEPGLLADRVRQAARGEWVIDPATAMEALRTAENPLTQREREVLRIAAEGLPVRDIAARLFLTEGTVRNHLSAAIRKLQAPDRLAAVRRAEDVGWL